MLVEASLSTSGIFSKISILKVVGITLHFGCVGHFCYLQLKSSFIYVSTIIKVTALKQL